MTQPSDTEILDWLSMMEVTISFSEGPKVVHVWAQNGVTLREALRKAMEASNATE